MTMLQVYGNNGQLLINLPSANIHHIEVVKSTDGVALVAAETSFNTQAATYLSGRKVKSNLDY